MRHINILSNEIGIRTAGSENESLAADYIARELESYGYLTKFSESFTLHNGLTSRNVWVEVPGERDEIMIIGAHYDSKPPSPGANDNGSGVAVVLELARVLAKVKTPYTVRFVFFGAEEIIDGVSDHHHYGSRFLADDEELIPRLHSMSSVDMVGVGTSFWLDNMGNGPDSWRLYLFQKGKELGFPVQTGEQRPWSDHEAFENAGVPVAWVHWRYDSEYHKVTDTADRIDTDLMYMTARLMLSAILEIEGNETVEVGALSKLIAFQDF